MRAHRGRPAGRGRAAGQSLVEMALVLPLIIVILLGTVDLGRAIFAYNTIAGASREGVRTAIVNQTVADIASRAAAQATGLGVDPTSTGCPATQPTGVCVQFSTPSGAACPAATYGCVAKVTVQYTFRAITPIIGSIVGPIVLTNTSVQAIESVCVDGAATCPIP